MGLLTAAQLFIGEEPLVYTAIASITLITVIAAGQPRGVPVKAHDFGLGLATWAAVALPICAYPLWVQLRGPLHEHSVLQSPWSGNLAFYVDPSGNLLFHTSASAYLVATNYLGLPEVLSYLGWPLIGVLVAAAIRYWRDPRVRAAAVTAAVLELLSLGGGPLKIGGFRLSGSFLPYHWLQGLPMMAQVLPDRFCILADGAAAAVLAFSLDRAWCAAGWRGWRGWASWGTWRGWAGWWRSVVPIAVVSLVLVPLLPLPYQATRPAPVPIGWQAAFARLRLAQDARVLVVPVPLVYDTQVMRWQADTGEPGSLVGGYFLGPGRAGQASFSIGQTQGAAEFLNRLWAGRSSVQSSSTALVRAGLAYWRPAAVVAVTGPGSSLGRFLVTLLGRPTIRVGRMLAWRR
jgi:hypothetical protein